MNKRKSRGGPIRYRPPRVRSVVTEGVYNNAHFMHAATSHVGNVVRIYTASGSVWEGVFRTFSSQFDVVLEVPAKVENPNSNNSTLVPDSVADKLIFKTSDIISMVARDVDLDFATRDTFQTDTAISAKFNGQQKNLEEKELEPWDPTSGVNGDEMSLELEPGANGWDANDMFRKNEQEYGVTSTYDQSLRGYTMQLQHTDSPDYREQEAKAEQIASEIESQLSHKARQEIENGDEEEQFAAVVRPNQDGFSKPGLDTTSGGGKYLPPAKRKNQTTGKLMRCTPPPSQGSSAQAPPPISHIRDNQNRETPSHVHMAPQNTMHIPSPPVNPQHVMNHVPTQHIYNPPLQRQGPPPNNPKPQINGEAKIMTQRNTRNNYVSQNNIPNQLAQARHRDEVKDLHKFSQDFKLSSSQPEPMVISNQIPEQLPPPPIQAQPPPPSPSLPQQSISPPQENLDKITNSFKKSTLNPNAKEFVLNPAAKPFTPRYGYFRRSPSTPSVSRPHTPQTPSHTSYIPATVSGPPGQPSMPVVMGYMLPSQPQYPPQAHPQGNRIRKVPMGQIRADMASQMQVAAATGQPLLAPAPIQQFVYPPGINPQAYQQMHTMRMYDSPQIQYIPQNPSNAPSPAQPPNQYTQNQGHQPPQQYQATPPPQGPSPFQIMCPIIPPPHMVPASMHYIQQPPPPQGPIQVLLPQPPHQPQQHAQAP
ncbi:hypothetical protein RN001_010768 [Aquatica leii]|uniref:LsmAD domain-containing protein n=1 Tax=Aquatica leii TaxID=1421715 RepID=A0AAN7P721_9COLE|nr:hypothetical protein RN001_010768 [Aquatica leii]